MDFFLQFYQLALNITHDQTLALFHKHKLF